MWSLTHAQFCGSLQLVEWNGGMEHWNGTLEWNSGMNNLKLDAFLK